MIIFDTRPIYPHFPYALIPPRLSQICAGILAMNSIGRRYPVH